MNGIILVLFYGLICIPFFVFLEMFCNEKKGNNSNEK